MMDKDTKFLFLLDPKSELSYCLAEMKFQPQNQQVSPSEDGFWAVSGISSKSNEVTCALGASYKGDVVYFLVKSNDLINDSELKRVIGKFFGFGHINVFFCNYGLVGYVFSRTDQTIPRDETFYRRTRFIQSLIFPVKKRVLEPLLKELQKKDPSIRFGQSLPHPCSCCERIRISAVAGEILIMAKLSSGELLVCYVGDYIYETLRESIETYMLSQLHRITVNCERLCVYVTGPYQGQTFVEVASVITVIVSFLRKKGTFASVPVPVLVS